MPIIIGVAGGSGSGKTTFARMLLENLGAENCVMIAQDSYYIDQSDKFDRDGGSVNFDHPDALEFSLLAKHLKQLKQGLAVEIPQYNFTTHTREDFTHLIEPKKIVLVDGILIFSQPDVIPHFDHKIYVDCPEDLRFQRRHDRDVVERGRSSEGISKQFYNQVKPMHDEFVEPSVEIACDVVTVENFDEKFEAWLNKVKAQIL